VEVVLEVVPLFVLLFSQIPVPLFKGARGIPVPGGFTNGAFGPSGGIRPWPDRRNPKINPYVLQQL